MSLYSKMILSVALIMLGVAAGADVVLSHGFAEAWREWQDGSFQMTLAGMCLLAGTGGMIIFPLTVFLAGRRRYRLQKAYGERYR